MGFPDHPSDQGRQDAPNMHVPAEDPIRPGYDCYPDYQGYPGQQPPGYAGYGMAGHQPGFQVRRVNSFSIVALVCGLAQFLLWFLLLVPGFIAALLGLIFGAVALGQIKRRGELGRWMAIGGIVLGGLGILGGIALGILIAVGMAHYHAHTGY